MAKNPTENEGLIQTGHRIDLVNPQSPQFDDWLDLRQKFMEARGWHFGDDFDEYDANPETVQIISTSQDAITAGMRLTPCDDIESTMSWSWLPDNLKVEAQANMPEHNGRVWDLTRLVTDEDKRVDFNDTVVELFGAGLAASRVTDESPRWVFATTVMLYRHFQRQGVEFIPIVRGKFSPDDRYDSILCYSDPACVAENLSSQDDETSTRVISRAEKGMASVSLRSTQS